MSGPTEIHRLIDRVHGRIFAHALAHALGVPRKWYALGQAERHYLSRDYQLQVNRKYRASLQGALLRSATREEWCIKRPELLAVERNPLWEVLKELASLRVDWDQRASTIMVNGQSVVAYRAAKRLWAYPSWTRLAYLLVLLRTRQPRYFLHRHAIGAMLVTYLALVCLEAPINHAAHDLFDVLSFYVANGPLDSGSYCWPADFSEFSKTMSLLQSGINVVAEREKRIARQSDVTALFWTMLSQGGGQFEWEDARARPVRERWRSAVLGFQHDVIAGPGWSTLASPRQTTAGAG